jgi:hypothetical protein
VRPSILTAVTTSRASDIAYPPHPRSVRCRETGRNYVLKPDTAGGTVEIHSGVT